MEKGNGLSEKETLMEKILLYCLKFPIGWSYYAGSCCCFSPVSEEKMKRLVKSTQRSIIREFKKTGILPFEGPLKPSDKNCFLGVFPLEKICSNILHDAEREGSLINNQPRLFLKL
jgi:hypothetical protein